MGRGQDRRQLILCVVQPAAFSSVCILARRIDAMHSGSSMLLRQCPSYTCSGSFGPDGADGLLDFCLEHLRFDLAIVRDSYRVLRFWRLYHRRLIVTLYTRPVSSALSCQRRWAAAWSYDATEDSTERFFTKYVLVTPTTSGRSPDR